VKKDLAPTLSCWKLQPWFHLV